MALDQAGDQARGRGVLDGVAQEGGAGLGRLGRADRLLHGGEVALQDAGAGELLEVLQQARLEAGERVGATPRDMRATLAKRAIGRS